MSVIAREVLVPVDEEIYLEGSLAIPPESRVVVLFAHGSGSSRHSPRNQYIASALQQVGISTLLFDLLTSDEEDQAKRWSDSLRFDIELLAERLTAVKNWFWNGFSDAYSSIGLYGSSTGAATALLAAAREPDHIGAVVSRGGRPDLVGEDLSLVRAPTLLIVGGADRAVLTLNQEAFEQLETDKMLELVAGAGHLFQEAGSLEYVAQLAISWFTRHLYAENAENKTTAPQPSLSPEP
jgi:pimeloyl-ACP methyl ester carboxylesterase